MVDTTPTPAPEACPACGSGKNSQDAAKVHTYYDCGNRYSPVLVDNNGDKRLSWVWGGGCTRSFSAAIALRQQVAELTARAEKAEARLGVTYCAYCGAEFPLSDDGNPDLVSEHIRTCDKHPMRELEADNAYLTHELNKAREKAATYERDWFDAKHEFGKTVKEFQAELTAARARVGELQAVCDAAHAKDAK